MFWEILTFYLIAISLISVIVCAYDKIAAKHNPKHRTYFRFCGVGVLIKIVLHTL